MEVEDPLNNACPVNVEPRCLKHSDDVDEQKQQSDTKDHGKADTETAHCGLHVRGRTLRLQQREHGQGEQVIDRKDFHSLLLFSRQSQSFVF